MTDKNKIKKSQKKARIKKLYLKRPPQAAIKGSEENGRKKCYFPAALFFKSRPADSASFA